MVEEEKTRKPQPVSFYPDAPLRAEMEARRKGSAYLGGVPRRDLERYYHAVAVELQAVHLTQGEACLIIDVMNGTITEPHTAQLLWAQVSDGIQMDRLDEKWEVDGPALVAKLRGLTYTQALAVADAAERWWELEDGERTWPEGLQAVGLLEKAPVR